MGLKDTAKLVGFAALGGIGYEAAKDIIKSTIGKSTNQGHVENLSQKREAPPSGPER